MAGAVGFLAALVVAAFGMGHPCDGRSAVCISDSHDPAGRLPAQLPHLTTGRHETACRPLSGPWQVWQPHAQKVGLAAGARSLLPPSAAKSQIRAKQKVKPGAVPFDDRIAEDVAAFSA
jgi:hypothetical protein